MATETTTEFFLVLTSWNAPYESGDVGHPLAFSTLEAARAHLVEAGFEESTRPHGDAFDGLDARVGHVGLLWSWSRRGVRSPYGDDRFDEVGDMHACIRRVVV